PSQLPSASRKEDRPEVALPPQKRLDVALGPRYEVGESSSAAAARPAGACTRIYTPVDGDRGEDVQRSLGASDRTSDLVHGEVISLRTTVLALQGQITSLQGQVTALQAQVATLQGQLGQQGLARGSTHPEPPEEAGGSA
nr:hypothetical protein [Tanacetum cinerariifolium]